MKHTRSHTAPFDRGYAERNVIHEETGTGSKIQVGSQIDRCRPAHAPFVQSGIAHPTGIDPRDHWRPRPR